ncbi:GNAT family N-acetyltransferase [Salipiger abyssi]|uniref:GNAT family N-acetyltransferase n=1 Tax=Salipiger abyssi TaxID=1250539 RepID=UPI00405A2F92
MQDTPVTIAPAAPEELEAIRALVDAAYRPYVPRMGLLPGPMRDDYAAHLAAERLLVLRAAGQVAGLLVLIDAPGHLLLDNVAVAGEAQGRGYGRLLMDHAEAEALRRGYDRICLYTHVTMVENIAIYARRGYEETHRAEVNGLHRVYMEKRLR